MGITGLWDEIGPGELVSLAALSTQFYKERGRPLRIAIDEAGWRFKNLTPYQVEQIRRRTCCTPNREGHILPCSRSASVEHTADFRRRPRKRGRPGGNRVRWDEIRELQKLLKCLSVPHQMAPSEAEAECARLQQEGIVDAVWTDDSDAFMFGTTMLFRTPVENNGSKSTTHVRVYRAEDIQRDYGLNQAGFVLFAMLAGGDYEVKGLPSCGPKKALEAIRRGFGESLCSCSNAELPEWRRKLQAVVRVEVPVEFPTLKALRNYTNPIVSSSAELERVRVSTHRLWNGPLNEKGLRLLLRACYNIWIKGYLKHIAPILLLRTLLATTITCEHTNNIYAIEIARTRKKKGEVEETPRLLRKITFLPQQVTTCSLTVQPEGEFGEDWSSLASSKNGEPFDPTARMECEMLEYALQTGVPHLLVAADYDANKPAHSAQKSMEQADDKDSSKKSRGRKRKAGHNGEAESLNETSQNVPRVKISKHNNKFSKAIGGAEKVARAPPAAFKMPPMMNFNDSIDLDDYGELDHAWPAPKPMPYVYSRLEYHTDDNGAKPALVPLSILALGLVAAMVSDSEPTAEDIRAKRLAHFDNSGSSKTAAGHIYEDAIVLD